MITTVQKWGNSQGLRLNKRLLATMSIQIGDPVDVTARQGEIVIRPIRPTRGKYDPKDLVRRIPESNETEELPWGEPVGKEVW